MSAEQGAPAAAPAPSRSLSPNPRSAVQQPPPLNLKKSVELPLDDDRGDVADWGRTGKEEPADLSGSEHHSMSSGMSPREQAWGAAGVSGPRVRAFSADQGVESLVHHTKKFVDSQKLRKCGPLSVLLRKDVITRSSTRFLRAGYRRRPTGIPNYLP